MDNSAVQPGFASSCNTIKDHFEDSYESNPDADLVQFKRRALGNQLNPEDVEVLDDSASDASVEPGQFDFLKNKHLYETLAGQ